MTDLELQKFLAEQLPDLIYYKQWEHSTVGKIENIFWRKDNNPVKETEWLHITRLVEAELYADQLTAYVKALASLEPTFCVIVLDKCDPKEDWEYEMSKLITASWQTRATALKQVLSSSPD
jgi:hypothetical protein